jgi:fructokinase
MAGRRPAAGRPRVLLVITVIGEAIVDLVVSPDWGCHAAPGGAPANVAVALARLGREVSLRARLSGDGFGSMMREHLTRNGISARDFVDASQQSTLAIATLSEDGQASYSFYANGTADWGWRPTDLGPLPDDVDALYLGSLAAALPPGAAYIESFTQLVRSSGRAVIVYDPNLRPSATPDRDAERRRVERQLRQVHVAKASEEDLRWLYPGQTVREVARRWQRIGPDLVVVTMGGEGAFGLSRDGTELTVPPVPADVVDTIGAGDSFSAGLIDAMAADGLLGRDGIAALAELDTARVGRLLTSAGIVAALTVERPGADPPRKAEVLERLAQLRADLAGPPGSA